MFLKAIKKLFVLFLILVVILAFSKEFVYSQTETPTPTPISQTSTIQECRDNNIIVDDCPGYLSGKISEKQGQAKTLSSQIAVMDNQINLTQARIQATKQQISNLILDIDTTEKKIANLTQSLDALTNVLLNRVIATYEVGRSQPFAILLSSGSVTNFFSRLNYLKIAQAHDKKLIYETQQAKNDYANQKQIFEGKKKKVEVLKNQLETYTAQLSLEKQNKQNLLTVTRNDESRYQQLLKEAQAQIAAFKSFSASAGGPSILPAQPSPDGWFYNQRDERWGRNLIGNSSEQVWEVGCLVASVAMLLKKHGENVTPADIAVRTSYFVYPTAYMIIKNNHWAEGRIASNNWGYNASFIDEKLSGGEPIIVGLNAGPYGQHFVVLKSGSNGDYIMNDPWYGANLKFSDYYSTGQIFQYGFYNG